MRRAAQIVVVLSVLAFAVVMAGCGGGTGAPDGATIDTAKKPPPAPPPPSTPCKIAFERMVKGDWQVFTINTDGTGEQQLTSGRKQGSNSSPSWSGDGRLCFASDRDGDTRLYVMDSDGSGQEAVSNPPSGCGDNMPSWCLNDPGTIVFSRHRAGTTLEWDICVLDLDSGAVEQRTTSPSYDDFPSCSRDGDLAVFTRKNDVENRKELYVASLSGAQQVTALTWEGEPIIGAYPEWSPGGDAIAFYYYADAWQVPVDPATGEALGPPQRLTTDFDAVREYYPTWSPTQDWIAYSTGSRVVAVELQTGNTIDLADGDNPDWSPAVFGQ